MGFYEDRLGLRDLKARGQAGENSEVPTDHSGDLEANIEGLFGQKMGPYHASAAGSGQDPRARVCSNDLRLQRVE
jgi:hypothetical protein